jgi:hypothetical protein
MPGSGGRVGSSEVGSGLGNSDGGSRLGNNGLGVDFQVPGGRPPDGRS